MTAKEIFDILTKEIGIIPEKEEDAQLWFKNAYKQGNENVQKALLELLTYDVIRPMNNDEKIMWLFRTVFHGKHENKKELRKMYYEGHGEEATKKEIVDFIKKEAINNDIESIIFMGHIHHGGFGVDKNIDIAHTWYEKAAKKGNAGAQIAVADYHFNKKEYEKAHNWYHKAALQNRITAYIRLSMMYKLGLGTEIKHEKSLFYKNKIKEEKGHFHNNKTVTNTRLQNGLGKKKTRTYKPKSKKKHEKR